jgi:hypothetical protein
MVKACAYDTEKSGRIHFYQGFQQVIETLDRLSGETATEGFDAVIDDASHLGKYTRISFWHQFRHHLKPGGIYVLDDWVCAYRSDWADGHNYTGTREASGDFGPKSAKTSKTSIGHRERIRRLVRSIARLVALRTPQKAESTARKNLYAC